MIALTVVNLHFLLSFCSSPRLPDHHSRRLGESLNFSLLLGSQLDVSSHHVCMYHIRELLSSLSNSIFGCKPKSINKGKHVYVHFVLKSVTLIIGSNDNGAGRPHPNPAPFI